MQKRRPQPRKPNFLLSHDLNDSQSNTVLQGIAVEHSVTESVPRKQVFPLSHTNTIEDEEFNFLPTSASEASVIAVNTNEDQQLLDVCMSREDFSMLSIKQPKLVPLPPSAFKVKHPDAVKQLPRKTSQTDKQLKQSSSEALQTDRQQENIGKLTGSSIKLKNLALQQEVIYIKKFLKKYYSIKEKLRYVQYIYYIIQEAFLLHL